MAIEEKIISYLEKAEERKRVRKIADSIDYSVGYTRQKCKELNDNNKILGAKTTPIPACDTGDEWFVLTGNRETLLDKIEKYTHRTKEEMEDKSTQELLDYTKEYVCERITSSGNKYWEFWA